MTGNPRTADTVGPDFYKTIVRSLQRMYDVVIMDTSVQYLEPLIAEVALGEADDLAGFEVDGGEYDHGFHSRNRASSASP